MDIRRNISMTPQRTPPDASEKITVSGVSTGRILERMFQCIYKKLNTSSPWSEHCFEPVQILNLSIFLSQQ